MIAGVVLAAGLARRMGRQKLLLSLEGKPVVRWAVERLLPHVEDLVVVTGHDDSTVRHALSGLAVRFAVVGVCAAVTLDKQGVCVSAGVGVTGAGTKAVRAKGVEAALKGKKLDAAAIEAAAQKAAEGVDVQADLQGSVEYKSHLCRVFAKRAITEAVKRAGA